MSEITQHLGFEASDAIATLKALDAALGGVNRRLTTFNERTGGGDRRIIQGFAQLSQEAQKAEAAVRTAGDAMKKTGNDGDKAGKQITLSWETMIRVVQTQALIRSLSLAQQLFRDSADAAEEFQISVARISTIANGAGSGFDDIAESVRGLSVELGRPVAEVASAAYETLQNDIGDTAESFDFLREAAGLAVSQGSEIEDAVGTLTSVLKSYGLAAAEAGDVSDTLFVAIDKGRITMDEIADKLGTVTPLAATLGINFQQTAAAIASLTQSGLDSATAMTQLRNVLQKMVKPGDDLQAAFTKLGVSTGNQLIEKFGGLQGALNALKDAFNGSEQEAAKAFGTIRGQLGVLNFLAQEGTLFNETLEAMDERAGKAAEALAKVDATDARQAQKSFAQLNDTILGLGETTQQLRTAAVDALNFLVPDAEAATVAITTLGIAFTALGARALAASPKLVAALAPLLPLAAAVAGALAVAFAVDRIGDFVAEMETAGDAVSKARDAAEQAAISGAQQSIARETELLRQAAEDRANLSDDWVEHVTANYEAIIEVAQDAEKRLVTNATASIEAFTDARRQAVQQIEAAIAEIDDRILDITKGIANSVRDLEEFNFERGLKGLSEQERTVRRITAAEEALRAAREAAANAGIDAASQAHAADLQNIAERKAEEALSAADRVGNTQLVAQAESVVSNALRQDVARQMADQQRLADFRKGAAQDAATELAERSKQETELSQRILDLQKQFDSGGKRKSVLQLEEDRKQAELLKQELASLLAQDLNVDLFKSLGVQDFVTQTTTSLVESLSSAEVNWAVQADAIQSVLDSRVFQASVSVKETATGATGNADVDQILGQIGNDPNANPAQVVEQARDALEAMQVQAVKANAELAKQKGIFAANRDALVAMMDTGIFQQFRTAAEGSVRGLGETVEALTNKFDTTPLRAFEAQLRLVAQALPGADLATQQTVQTQINEAKVVLLRLVEAGRLSAEQARQGLAAVQAAERALAAKVAQQGAEASPISAEAVEVAKQRIAEIEAAISQATLAPETSALESNLDQAKIKANAVETELRGVKQEATGAGQGVGQIKANADSAGVSVSNIGISMGSVVGQTNNATQAMNALAAAAREAAAAAAQANAAAGGGFAYHGGKVDYRAVGGPTMARGADTQLTVTQPGEFIMNARQSRNFAAELQAMNAGQRPQYRDKGGSVTNVGDINVNISGSAAQGVDGDALARTLKRRLRHETSSL